MKYIYKAMIIFAILFSSQAKAGWDLIAESTRFKVYLDSATIKQQGPYTTFWVLHNYYEAQKNSASSSYISTKTLMSANCGDRTIAIKTLMMYTLEDGGGISLPSEITSSSIYTLKYADVAPDTVGDGILAVVCSNQ